MKVFLDANVLVAVVNKEYPLFTYAARILSLSGKKNFEIFTSPLALAITFYFSQKKSGKTAARQKIELLAKNLGITSTDRQTVHDTIKNKKITDFEDGLQYYGAVRSGCKAIVTEDTGDFFFSDIEVLSCRQFFENYMA